MPTDYRRLNLTTYCSHWLRNGFSSRLGRDIAMRRRAQGHLLEAKERALQFGPVSRHGCPMAVPGVQRGNGWNPYPPVNHQLVVYLWYSCYGWSGHSQRTPSWIDSSNSIQSFPLGISRKMAYKYCRLMPSDWTRKGIEISQATSQACCWLVVSTTLEIIRKLGWSFPLYRKMKIVPSRQPDND